jgi:hypothetical protein
MTDVRSKNVWFSPGFNSYVNKLQVAAPPSYRRNVRSPVDSQVLPYDHHMLAALIAPRALLAYENTDYEWLSPLSTYGCMSNARTAWQALGVPTNMGFVQVGGHAHCAFPSSLTNSLNAFIGGRSLLSCSRSLLLTCVLDRQVPSGPERQHGLLHHQQPVRGREVGAVQLDHLDHTQTLVKRD